MTRSKVAIVLAFSLLFAVGFAPGCSTLVAKKLCYETHPIRCQGARLSGVNLKGADLTDANLRGANLGYAGLRGANLKGADLTDANLPDGSIHD